MSFFACAIRTDGGQVPASFRESIESARFCRGRQLGMYAARGFVGATDQDEGGARPVIASMGLTVAIGVARLDNRAEVVDLMSRREDGVSDLGLLLQFVTRDGGARIDRLVGDFAFVVWDPTSRQLIAARDTFGVRKLYYGKKGGLMALCSRAEPLATGDEYDVQYLVDRIAYCTPDPERTVYAGVRAVPPASVLRLRNNAPVVTTYWSAATAQGSCAASRSPRDQCDEFRALLIDAVRLRLADGPYTWSHLSGGLDSSSVVSVAQWLEHSGAVAHGLAGAVTYTDSLGTGADEKEYSDAVVQRWGVRNELVPHQASRHGAMIDPPLLDQPNRSFPAAARDRAVARVITHANGRVLLTGLGGDNLVLGTMFFFADWIAAGHLWPALREMAHRAALGRVSFWELAYRNALLPLLPARLRRALARDSQGAVPRWVNAAAARRFDIGSRVACDGICDGRRGHKYEDAQAALIAAIPSTLIDGPEEDALDVRHPYLHRPLVELALRLPPEMCVRPHERKWVLRESMRGILPETVRTRVGKGEADGLEAWSLTHEQRHIDRLLDDPILAQLGCIDPSTLRDSINAVRQGRPMRGVSSCRAGNTLEVELWLQLRSGRWAAEGSQHSSSERSDVK